MILEDFVMLGKTIPEPSSDGRIFVCSAGLSNDLRSLVRIYPLARQQSPRRWSVSQVMLERNPQDSRDESWRLRGDRSLNGHEAINSCFKALNNIARENRDKLLSSNRYRVDSIKQLNAERRSLGIIVPIGKSKLDFSFNMDSPESPQYALFAEDDEERKRLGARRFAYQPYLEFKDADGWHRLQIRDWGVYEFMRKHGDDRRHELFAACHLDKAPCLLVGNMSHQRTVWLVISVLVPLQQMAMAI